MSNYHVPVLLSESVDALNIKKDGVYVDVTFGGGGHSKEILSRLSGNSRLIVFDQDQDSFVNIPENERLIFANSNFRYLKRFLRYYNIDKIDGLLGDLGVSSHHFDSPERGFSFRFEGDLDMRMNQSQEMKASDVLNTYSRQDLTNILRFYGELKNAYKLSNVICARREEREFATIEDFTESINPFIPKFQEHKFLAKIFQALRIETNKELDALKEMLMQASEMLNDEGRLSIISYHSLEDRLVKTFFKTGTFDGKEEKDFYGNSKSNTLKVISKKPILATDEEIEINNRARSAKLRVAEKK
jgi:16S rRNA (cytosine1402-N4)-methyltransferase